MYSRKNINNNLKQLKKIMAAMSQVPVDEQKKTAYRKSTRREYGEVVSIDMSFKLIKEFLEARQMVEAGPMPISDNEETNRANMEMYEKRVKPFFDHMSEIIDTL